MLALHQLETTTPEIRCWSVLLVKETAPSALLGSLPQIIPLYRLLPSTLLYQEYGAGLSCGTMKPTPVVALLLPSEQGSIPLFTSPGQAEVPADCLIWSSSLPPSISEKQKYKQERIKRNQKNDSRSFSRNMSNCLLQEKHLYLHLKKDSPVY